MDHKLSDFAPTSILVGADFGLCDGSLKSTGDIRQSKALKSRRGKGTCPMIPLKSLMSTDLIEFLLSLKEFQVRVPNGARKLVATDAIGAVLKKFGNDMCLPHIMCGSGDAAGRYPEYAHVVRMVLTMRTTKTLFDHFGHARSGLYRVR